MLLVCILPSGKTVQSLPVGILSITGIILLISSTVNASYSSTFFLYSKFNFFRSACGPEPVDPVQCLLMLYLWNVSVQCLLMVYLT